jgi:uncharacterized membrane protein YhaH (DUF805 family)
MKYYVERVFNKYAEFTGRARRAEYWYFYLFNLICTIIINIIAKIIGDHHTILNTILWLITIVPSLAVAVRRLHDTNKSGWWMLIILIPIIGWIWIIVLLATDSTPGANKYGPNPKEVKEATLAKE